MSVEHASTTSRETAIEESQSDDDRTATPLLHVYNPLPVHGSRTGNTGSSIECHAAAAFRMSFMWLSIVWVNCAGMLDFCFAFPGG